MEDNDNGSDGGMERTGGELTAVPAVTVVMPTYERVELIGEALESALAQTYQDFVVLIGDNSESDATEALVEAMDDPRIHYHRNRPGLGPLGNWLDLVARARSPLIATLHDDDRWLPDYLSTVVPPMIEDPSIAMTFTDFWLIDSEGDRLIDYTEQESARTHRAVLPGGRFTEDYAERLRLVAVWNAPQPLYAAVSRRDALLSCTFEPDSLCPDLWFSYHLVKQRAGLYYVPERLTEYRVHPGALTSKGFHDSEDAVFSTIVAENEDLPVAEEIAAYWSSLRWSRATRLLAGGGDSRDASQHEFLAAADHLDGPKRVVAEAAGRSSLLWHGLRQARSARLHARPRPSDVRYG